MKKQSKKKQVGFGQGPVTGWVILHPDGRVETDYFGIRIWHSDHSRYENLSRRPGGTRVSREAWRQRYRPDCQMVRATLSWKSAADPVLRIPGKARTSGRRPDQSSARARPGPTSSRR